jgi:hypothetical protein
MRRTWRSGPLALLPVVVAACARGDQAARASEAAGPFAALDRVDVGAAPGSRWPNLAAGPDGALALSWLEPAGGAGTAPPDTARHRLRVVTLGPDGRWSAPRTVAEGRDLLVNWADFPAVVPMGAGRLAAWWPVRNPRGDFAYDALVSASRDGGATWSPPRRPHHDGTATEHGFVSFVPPATAGDGGAVVWLDGRDYARGQGGAHGGAGGGAHGAGGPEARMQLVAAPLGADGAPGAEQVVDSSACSCCRTAAARTRRGVVVAYRDRQPGEVRNIAVVRHEPGPGGGAWSAPHTVHDDGWVIPGCPTNGSAVAARGDTVAVAWFTAPRDSARVHVAFSVDGGRTFGPPARVDDGAPAGRVGVAVAADGAALVTWVERAPDGPAPGGSWRDAERAAKRRPAGDALWRVRRVAPDGARGPAQTVAPSTPGRAGGFPQIAVAGGPGGDAVYLAWTEPAAGGRPSQVQVLRARGPAAAPAARPTLAARP